MYILLETTTMTKAPPCPIVNPFEWSPKLLSKTWKVESYQPPLVHSQNLCLRLGKRLVAALCKSKEAHGGPVMDTKTMIRWFSYYCNGLPAQNGCYLREFQAIQAWQLWHVTCTCSAEWFCKIDANSSSLSPVTCLFRWGWKNILISPYWTPYVVHITLIFNLNLIFPKLTTQCWRISKKNIIPGLLHISHLISTV